MAEAVGAFNTMSSQLAHSYAELERALEAGFTPAGLGPWTLRADTAAAAALALYRPG